MKIIKMKIVTIALIIKNLTKILKIYGKNFMKK